jgi:hypothetical protein
VRFTRVPNSQQEHIMFTLSPSSGTLASPEIVPVRAASAASQALPAGAGWLRRTLGRFTPSRRTLGYRYPSRRTLGRRFP